ncbi:MAG: hypothetical protein NPIRA04_06620 [Nitrospirales bacterium]|nr:MAG: hypothetical protein NPIRA04_06620 [Nitrospirales bacterium]
MTIDPRIPISIIHGRVKCIGHWGDELLTRHRRLDQATLTLSGNEA